MQTKYVFFTKKDGEVTRMLEITTFPMRWTGDASTMRKVLNHLAGQSMYLDNTEHIDRLPEMFKGDELYCIKNPVNVTKADWASSQPSDATQTIARTTGTIGEDGEELSSEPSSEPTEPVSNKSY
jgi:hypothetical protein